MEPPAEACSVLTTVEKACEDASAAGQQALGVHLACGLTGHWGGSVAREQSAAAVTTMEAGHLPKLLSPAAPLTQRG